MPIDDRIFAMRQVLTEFANQLDQFIVVSVKGTRVAIVAGAVNSP
jgi:hypothetical protein